MPPQASTAVIQLFLGRLLSIQGRPREARAILESAAAVLKGRDDVDPEHLANALLYLGEAYLDEGRVAEAGAPLGE